MLYSTWKHRVLRSVKNKCKSVTGAPQSLNTIVPASQTRDLTKLNAAWIWQGLKENPKLRVLESHPRNGDDVF